MTKKQVIEEYKKLMKEIEEIKNGKNKDNLFIKQDSKW